MTDVRDPFNLVGFTVAEKYAVESVVGETGYALLYRAVHVAKKQPVALQAFKALGEFDADSRERLLRIFMKQGAQLKDIAARAPTLRAPRDIGPLTMRDGKWVPYMVFEWLDGTSLDTILARDRDSKASPRSLEAAMSLLEPIALALELAHEEGLSHLDVKPSNVFIGTGRATSGGPPGTPVRLFDFGTAAAVSRALAKTGASIPAPEEVTFTITPSYFTPTYAAPEQFLSPDPPVGPWTDVFALALVLTEMITGSPPNDGDVGAIAKGKRLTPRARGAPLQDAVDAVFARALLADHRQRFASAGPFWNALRAALGKPTIRLSPANRASPPSSRRGGEVPAESSASHPIVPPPGAVPFATSTPEPWPTAMSNRAPPLLARSGALRTIGRVTLAAVLGAGAAALVIGVMALLQRGAPRSSATAPASLPPSAARLAPPPPSASTGLAVPSCPDGMVGVPALKAVMGSDDKDALDLEKPAHKISLSAFCIDRVEVTTSDFKACSDAGACMRATPTNDWKGITDKDHKAFDPLCNLGGVEERGHHPVNCVSWEAADNYCKAKSKRLPTEAEWELAARGPDGRRFPWGDDAPGAKLLNACGKECVAWGKKIGVEQAPLYPDDDGWPGTAPVGTFPKGASRYGVEDLAGNVAEWVSDWYGPYSADPQVDPKGPPSGDSRVIRGVGAWGGFLPGVRATFRYHDPPSKHGYGIGFRCARASGS